MSRDEPEDLDDDLDEDDGEDGGDGAAVFPIIPVELGVDPLFLAVLHAIVFLQGSGESIVEPDSAEEALHYIASYLQRLDGERLARTQEDLQVLIDFARSEGWPKMQIEFLKSVLKDMGVGEGDEA